MITETLSLLCGSDLISDSALKVVLSYYPVCRCQRTSRSRTFETTKKLNLESDLNSGLPSAQILRRYDPIYSCRDKIEFNLQSPDVRRTHSKLEESRFQRNQ